MKLSKRAFIFAAFTIALAIALVALDSGVRVRATFVASVCMLLWLTGWVPVWVPTIVLWVATPLMIGIADNRFAPLEVLRWSVDPVIALFLGGFALAAAARRHGVDDAIAAVALKRAGNSSVHLIGVAAFSTAFLSMWMSNVAAAALMLNAFRPIWGREPDGSALRRSLLLGIALAANVGGIATPIGTGANGIAMAAVAHTRQISFLHWMAFGVPLAMGLVAAAVVLVIVRLRPPALGAQHVVGPINAQFDSANAGEDVLLPPLKVRSQHWWLGGIFAITVALWLSEPLHGLPAFLVALGAVLALLVFRIIPIADIVHLDWGTLMLVAGGIGLGALLDRSGIMSEVAAALPLADVPVVTRLLGLCMLSAGLSALMSNTGTAALLIPLAATVDPDPSTAIIVAIACSLGMPFVVSTPPNAMAVAGGLRSSDLLWPGLILMVGGCALLALTGPWVLNMVGIP